MSLTFKKISVLGAGTMGSGIAQVCAQAGCETVLYEINPEVLKSAKKAVEKDLQKAVELKKLAKEDSDKILKRIRFTHNLQECENSELVIEAVSEKLDIKEDIFSKLDDFLSPQCVFATNTSSLSVTLIASRTRYPDRVCGLHFFNPAQRMKLVEVVAAHQSTPEIVEKCMRFSAEIGKDPVKVQDFPGFIVNRVARPYYGEALRCLGEGVADIQTIDKILRDGGKFKMGAFELMDLIGIDINYAATKSVWEAYFHDPRYRPHLIQRKMLEAGHLGRKTGRGFYEYPNG